ncbi:hypothetical protein H9635_03845 [Solibacillus sp. A46]|uniref:Uncharacterized protein n=1 Tax=Solibacillus faecavium TaxID=2762221 RepID=A0ABR8XV84_9BACL|nr:hypothetical protein [Solibacillus faecavium]MBD8035861.1 hypothetical protein [Solibacillus faecavium]
MKQTIAYGAYFLIAATVTYFVDFFLFFLISGILFDAADAPPGDISDNGKLLLSVGMPVIYAFILFALYYLYSNILKSFNIHLMLSVGVLFHIMVALYLIWNAVPYAF